MAHRRQRHRDGSGWIPPRSASLVLALMMLVVTSCSSGTTASSPIENTDRPATTAAAVTSSAEPSVEPTESSMEDRGDAGLAPEDLVLDTSDCPAGPSDEGPILIGTNGGGFTSSRHIEGLQTALDEANAENDDGSRPFELITAIEEQSDSPNSLVHLGSLLDRGDLHAIVPWSGWPDPNAITPVFDASCTPGLFWLGAPAPDATWVVPGLDDDRAQMAVIATWLVDEVAADHVAVLPLDWPSQVSVGESLAAALRARGVPNVTISPVGLDETAHLDINVANDPGRGVIDAIVVTTPGGQCASTALEARAQNPEAVIIVDRRCDPSKGVQDRAFGGMVRTRWLDQESSSGPELGDGFGDGLAAGRAVVATVRSAARLDGGATRENILRSARTLRTVVPDLAPGVLLRTDGVDDLFARESAVMDVYEVDPPSPQVPGWHQLGPVVEADGSTLMTEIDWSQPVVEEPQPCDAPKGLLKISTGHWFAEAGRLDPLADVVLHVANANLGVEPAAVLVATGADGTAISLPMVLGRGGQSCDDEIFFDIQPGQISKINDLRQPVDVVFEIGDSLSTVAVQWPEDFPDAPPFDPVELEPADGG